MADQVKVFLSYRRADTQHVAGRFADKIGERFAVFMDIDTIPPGVDFTDYVRRAVGGCDVLLAFIGSQWADAADPSGRRRLDDPADWVREEIATALQRDVRVIPVLVDGAALPDPGELPESLRALTLRQTLPLRHASFSADAARLVTAIQTAADQASSAEPYAARWEAAPPPPPVQVRVAESRATPRRRLLPAIGFVLAVIIAVILGVVAVLALRPAPAAVPSATPPSAPSATLARSPGPQLGRVRTVAQLKSYVPAALQPTCRPLQPEAEALRTGLEAAVQCVPPPGSLSPQYLFYFAYTDTAAADQAFRNYYGTATLPPGTCAESDAEINYDSQGDRPVTGTLRCYSDPKGLAVFAWNHDQLSIVASAADQNLSFGDLRQFFELAGPVAPDR